MLTKSVKGKIEVRTQDVVNVIESYDDLKTRLSRRERDDLAALVMKLFEEGPPRKKYRVIVPEVHLSIRYVEARDAEEALDLGYNAEESHLEFHKTLDDDDALNIRWEVEEA